MFDESVMLFRPAQLTNRLITPFFIVEENSKKIFLNYGLLFVFCFFVYCVFFKSIFLFFSFFPSQSDFRLQQLNIAAKLYTELEETLFF